MNATYVVAIMDGFNIREKEVIILSDSIFYIRVFASLPARINRYDNSVPLFIYLNYNHIDKSLFTSGLSNYTQMLITGSIIYR